MPEVTIYIHSNSIETHTHKAVQSFLMQKGVEFEILAMDKRDRDNNLEIIKSFNDSRIRIIKLEKGMGRAYLNNQAIKRSSAPFIVFAESDHILLDDAIKRLYEAISSSDHVGLVHCFNFIVNEDGKISKESFHKIFRQSKRKLRTYSNYKNEILCGGMDLDGLRIYRREVFEEVGLFDETLQYDENHDLALRMFDKFEIVLMPEFPYCVRKKKSYLILDKFKKAIKIPGKRSINNRVLKHTGSTGLNQIEYNPIKVLLYGLFNVLHLGEIPNIVDQVISKAILLINRIAFIPLFNRIYASMIKHCSWWPIGLFSVDGRNTITTDKKIAYYIWQFPVSSQTFVQREVAALINSGHSVVVISEIQADDEFLTEYKEILERNTLYLQSLDGRIISKYKKYFLFKNPIVYISLFLYIVFHNYHFLKSFNNDKKNFYKGILLAGVGKHNNINHLHSPWADNSALVSLVASKFLGISYSLQARAHEIHRRTYKSGLEERLCNADFIITNSQYNRDHIKKILNNNSNNGINLIYNGVNLDQFIPNKEGKNISEPFKILSVARLIEQKGLVYLLGACKILKDKGYSFNCDIIGGTENQYMNYYLTLKKLHKYLGLQSCVSFLGSQPFTRVLDAYENADIFVLPCVIAEDGSRDITPNSLIEAMAMKLPVISTDITGIPEIVENGVSGILVPPHDEVKLSEAIMELIEYETLRKRLGINARKRVEKRFDINKNVGQFIELFNQANKDLE